MQNVTLVGIDLGKHSFHLHGQDKAGKAVFRRKVSRKQLVEFFATFHACTVMMEACAGAHCCHCRTHTESARQHRHAFQPLRQNPFFH